MRAAQHELDMILNDANFFMVQLREDMKFTSASVQAVKDFSGPSDMELKMKLDVRILF